MSAKRELPGAPNTGGLTRRSRHVLLSLMLELCRADGRLQVVQGPGPLFKLVVFAWVLLILCALAAIFAGIVPASSGLVVGVLLAPTPVFFRGLKRNECEFDPSSGSLKISDKSPVRAERTRTVPLSRIARLGDRRSPEGRAIELVFEDGGSMVVVRGSVHDASTLDLVARELSRLLRKPLRLAEGVVVAGRFEIENFVAEGGMGVVYRAGDRETRSPVALKLIQSTHREYDERFAREIRHLSSIEHTRIAGYVAHGRDTDGSPFLAMAWLEGEDLARALSRDRLSAMESLSVLEAAAEAVAVIHARGIVHRDLKPSNLFLRGGELKDLVLIDFGLARRLEMETRLTASRATLGTPYYMAPEQISNAAEVLPAADIFSLGCVFYECITGVRPFESPQFVGILARVLFDTPRPVHELEPAVPEAWSSLLQRMLSKDPGARPPHGAALLRELRTLPPAAASTSQKAEGTRDRVAEESDQVLVCVVLATPAGAPGPAFDASTVSAIEEGVSRFGARLQRLPDGSLLATISPRQSATDLVQIAARCAMHLRDRLPEAKIAVTTGRAPLQPNPRIGDAVDRAAQLLGNESLDSGIRLDSLTCGLLHGRFTTITNDGLHFLVGQDPQLDESRPLLGKPTPCVGRELELTQLEAVASAALDEARPSAATVVGAPGVGKSRLRHELLRRLLKRHPGAIVLVGYGDPLNAGSPYGILADALLRRVAIRAGDISAEARSRIVEELCRNVEDSARQRVAEFLGELCGVPFPAADRPPLRAARADNRVMSEQVELAFKHWLAAECATRKVVLVLEDLQWGDALTVKTLEKTLRDLTEGSLFLLSLARPEVDEAFPRFLGGRQALSLVLGPLSTKASELLIKGALGDQVDADSLARMVRLASGNALFLEELIRAAAEGKAGDVPETVLAILQARLSRLPQAARLVMRAASVLGEVFWSGAVRHICESWGAPGDPDHCLFELVELELISRTRTFQHVGEYAFRHALVRDAAYGLVTVKDRAEGHRSAGRWLELAGEADAIVLAHHAERGGEPDRAAGFLARAAEQSLVQHDFNEALSRAARGIALGAEGEVLGILQSVKANALYSLGRWFEVVEVGIDAIARMPQGDTRWCATVETLLQVLPGVDAIARMEELSDAVLQVVPTIEARPAYVRALYVQILGYCIFGARERGRRLLAAIDERDGGVSERDVVARGYATQWRAYFEFFLGSNLSMALSWAEQSVSDLETAQVMYRLSHAHTVQAFVRWGLGDHAGAERHARVGRAIAEQSRDAYHAAIASWYLGLTLCELPDASSDEVETCARALRDLGVDQVRSEGVSLLLTARAALTRRDWLRAEIDARAARPGIVTLPAYRLMGGAYLVHALLGQGRSAEAAEVAREDRDIFDEVGSPIFSEVLFLVASAEAFRENGDAERASAVLDEALHHIDVRARSIADPTLKESYLTRRDENRRALELAQRWRCQ